MDRETGKLSEIQGEFLHSAIDIMNVQITMKRPSHLRKSKLNPEKTMRGF